MTVKTTEDFQQSVSSDEWKATEITMIIRRQIHKQIAQSGIGYPILHVSMPQDLPANLCTYSLDRAKSDLSNARQKLATFKKRKKTDVVLELQMEHTTRFKASEESNQNMLEYRLEQLQIIRKLEEVARAGLSVNAHIPRIISNTLKKMNLDRDEITSQISLEAAKFTNIDDYDADKAYDEVLTKLRNAVQTATKQQKDTIKSYPIANKAYRELLKDFYDVGVRGLSENFDTEMRISPKSRQPKKEKLAVN